MEGSAHYPAGQASSTPQTRLSRYRAWYIYAAASDFDRSFTLPDLQEAIHRKSGVRPHASRLARELRQFKRRSGVPLIEQVGPERGAYRMNTSIDLGDPTIRHMLAPPQDRMGRPLKPSAPSYREKKRYNAAYWNLTHHPEHYLCELFSEDKPVSINDVTQRLPELADGIPFGPDMVKRLLHRYCKEARGPPYIEEIEYGGVYRRIAEPGTGRSTGMSH